MADDQFFGSKKLSLRNVFLRIIWTRL